MGAQMVKKLLPRLLIWPVTVPPLQQFWRSNLNEGLNQLLRHEPNGSQRGIDKGVAAVVEALGEMSQPCTETKAIAQVGSISANSDTTVGDIIADAMEKVGKEGVITVEDGPVWKMNWM